ncbi:flagellar hook protein FlgE [Plesiomonas shigelloides]|uniref:flagellar hook protein FlgE n=1 Tax=Plesiomonas TaxID=702 RepID=UPI0012618850|nr:MULTISPECIES: flagellar hook protein FlgE [Plesiomonas]KAB7698662.1 flagellar hook-basal body complex protein [Plesiomonas shigelloides]KAB7709443.1 flagellar hook-basal body complex protein [Plesiomonas shigelloides]MCE5165034.1 flagellar hook protein FlgE [Plesiomonas sp. PI-19]QOH79794.1 flagellar hook protein FlgE [Plesiomonas shigelloides]
MSFNIGLSGLQATSEQMNTISHNIANGSTAGFKSSRTEFQDVYSATFGGGQANGVAVSNIRQSFATGSMTTTNRNGDLAINGDGFFVVENNGQKFYTRAGIFDTRQDKNNPSMMNLVSPDGSLLLGKGGQPIAIDKTDQAPKASTKGSLGLNLDSGAPIIDAAKPFDINDPSTYNSTSTVKVYDKLGNEHQVTQYYRKTADGKWDMHVAMDNTLLPGGATPVEFDDSGKLTKPSPSNLSLTLPNGQPLALDMSAMTQYGGGFSINSVSSDGYAAGKFANWSFESDGTVVARYTNGEKVSQGQLQLARFTNNEGLQPAGGNRWTETFASGQAMTGVAGEGQLGGILTGRYENSNVNITDEMVGLMGAQSSYQANAKSIQVANEMTKILFNSL